MIPKKKKLLLWRVLLALVIMFYYVFWLNTVSVVNNSGYDLENVTVSKYYARDRNPILWKGQVPANSRKYFYIPASTSGDRVILEASWQGEDIAKEQEYPAIGPGKFKFILSRNGQMSSHVKEIPWYSPQYN